jgi:ankyrin repeat protein
VTPLLISCANGHKETTKFLTKTGADLHAVEERGIGAIHSACVKGSLEVVDLLLTKGDNIETKTEERFTSLMVQLSLVSFQSSSC